MEFKIEKNIPIPNERNSANNYPFKNMDIGDSFIAGNYSRDNMVKFGNAARNWANKYSSGWKYACRKTDDGMIRVWRIK